jgi:hypothetical protein
VKVGTTESEIKNGTLLIEVEARLRDDDVAAELLLGAKLVADVELNVTQVFSEIVVLDTGDVVTLF